MIYKSWERVITSRTLKGNTIKWYTDSSNKGHEQEYLVPGVFQTETGKCTKFNLKKNYQKSDIAIFSDNQAVIKDLSSHVICSKMVWKCLVKLNELGKNNKFL